MAVKSSVIIPFVEKYRPKELTDFVGNRNAVIELEKWLKNWKIQKKKVALLVGPAGTGKTSVVMYLANKYNFEFVEVNASDKRNKKAIDLLVGKSSTEGTILRGAKVRKLILVDEADGLFGQEDRGGGTALQKAIVNTRVPIIATANDAEANSLKSAKKYMKIIKFERLSSSQILKLLLKIREKEELSVTEDTLIMIAENSGGDARSALNDLESIAYNQDLNEVIFSSRNKEKSLEETMINIFSVKDMVSARKATEGIDVDYRELLRYINEHAYKEAMNSEELSEMYKLIAEADFYLSQCYITQNWSLLKYFFAIIASIGLVKQSPFKYAEFKFPSYWAKIGQLRFKHAKLNSIIEKSKSKLHCSTNEFKSIFYPYLELIFTKDPVMAAGIALWLRLDENEILFLTNKSKTIMKKIMQHMEKAYLENADKWLVKEKAVTKSMPSPIINFDTLKSKLKEDSKVDNKSKLKEDSKVDNSKNKKNKKKQSTLKEFF